MEINEKTSRFQVGPVPTVIYIPDFISDAEETQLSNHIYQAPVSKWKTLKNRRLQNWGGVVHEKGLISQDLPLWLTKLNQRIYEEFGIFPATPNHVLINEYLPDQGIMPHQDGPAYFPAAAILSLGSPVVMNFTPHVKLCEDDGTTKLESHFPSLGSAKIAQEDSPQNFSLLLMPRSLLIFKDLAYSDYLHGIEDNAVQHYDGAVNLTEANKNYEANEPASRIGSTASETEPEDMKVLRRMNTRISLTCRLVLKVRKNLIKI
ncbi:alkylated DNA repair protein ALKBH6 homolog [Silene latifolia]|uniref:alkylated DNA repair protein ALKBH6 homolog n=1 Tax=Silene latifolia TaxID=37657 RepID=UPI003D77D038